MITKLEPNQIFVFGSNTAGRHGRGAALQAMRDFGAVYGVGEGITGQCYALPTLDSNLQQLPESELVESICNFLNTADDHPELTFLLTKVGCGLAGYDESYIRDIFHLLLPPTNVIMPDGW